MSKRVCEMDLSFLNAHAWLLADGDDDDDDVESF